MAFFLMKDVAKGKTLTLKGELILEAVIELDDDDPKVSAQSK